MLSAAPAAPIRERDKWDGCTDPRDQADADYASLIARLNRASVTKYYLAYEDIPWDDPEYAIDPADPRWIQRDQPLAQTAWFREQPEETQARICLHMVATFMKYGAQFENVLSRGLLEFAGTLPNHAPEFRYAYHEVIEESHHSLMFQEFVNRTGLVVEGLHWLLDLGANRIPTFGRTFPELFFIYVLGGEDPIDYQQRTLVLSAKSQAHPLLYRVSQVHVTEEARHISFARAYLRRNVPKLSRRRMRRLRIATPFILGIMSRMMMQASDEVVSTYEIPASVVKEAYRENSEHDARRHAALGRLAGLCRELEILQPPYDRLWRHFDLIPG